MSELAIVPIAVYVSEILLNVACIMLKTTTKLVALNVDIVLSYRTIPIYRNLPLEVIVP